MDVPDDLLLTFFTETTSRLLELDAEAAVVAATENGSTGDASFDLADCRRCVLDQQKIVLNEVTEGFQKNEETSSNNDNDNALGPARVQERLGGLQHEADLSEELRAAMEEMNDAARVAVCKLVLYKEEALGKNESKDNTSPSRNLQDEGRLERTKMMEYFVLCQAALKLECVLKFIGKTSGDSIFEKANDAAAAGNNTVGDDEKKTTSSAAMMFPQSRLEHVQRLLAKGVGWDPVFVTSELRKIFVEKPSEVDYGYYDGEVMALFRQLVEQMTAAIRTAMLQIQSKQDARLLNDLAKGGNTRVVSVQYSEFDVDKHGNRIESSSSSSSPPENNAPEQRIDERAHQPTEEETKRQLRLASEAALLQQTILGELLTMNEDERNDRLREAAEASRKFTEDAMALPTGQERIEFLRSIDPSTSRQLAMHKLWNGMLQANGGKPPKMVVNE
mmetsp:Transcript_21350/g.44991  ORF Transcript_21350/g.44991 Transcript_21350/m.44991 type:complete len:447 (-) Transcript_21350:1420-2760(-)|eukprot:CAMPEP_0201121166 /NCGR_PEP_ID=MMETSP0850-20130426/5113_1 /ASSEMBLY_ACC=CAM_ASM_000622 /TAXON_ID=183588 /ORGANISM="Pseudo-nitzschia fraudulenta, Strain WWA7" /LENGTH=446 /DNA_ID=CAMNT_0047387551 /DNA_START=129 /DNA_END=1469 /DNA_ORIENTATION=+